MLTIPIINFDSPQCPLCECKIKKSNIRGTFLPIICNSCRSYAVTFWYGALHKEIRLIGNFYINSRPGPNGNDSWKVVIHHCEYETPNLLESVINLKYKIFSQDLSDNPNLMTIEQVQNFILL